MSDDDFDDFPETHLDDDEYAAYLEREFDADGGVRAGPPVARFILMLIVLLSLVILLLFL
ncbi:MAG: hypothetical protein O2894_04570 [Planctomycetota bacterium]|nr:hypothetical protein [Planctomycetota bacterium]